MHAGSWAAAGKQEWPPALHPHTHIGHALHCALGTRGRVKGARPCPQASASPMEAVVAEPSREEEAHQSTPHPKFSAGREAREGVWVEEHLSAGAPGRPSSRLLVTPHLAGAREASGVRGAEAGAAPALGSGRGFGLVCLAPSGHPGSHTLVPPAALLQLLRGRQDSGAFGIWICTRPGSWSADLM